MRILSVFFLLSVCLGCTTGNDNLQPSQGQTTPALQTLSDFVRAVADTFTDQGINSCEGLEAALQTLPLVQACDSGEITLEDITAFTCTALDENATFQLDYAFVDCLNSDSSLAGPLTIQFTTNGINTESTLFSTGLVITGANYTFSDLAGPEQCSGTLFANGNPCQITADCLNCVF